MYALEAILRITQLREKSTAASVRKEFAIRKKNIKKRDIDKDMAPELIEERRENCFVRLKKALGSNWANSKELRSQVVMTAFSIEEELFDGSRTTMRYLNRISLKICELRKLTHDGKLFEYKKSEKAAKKEEEEIEKKPKKEEKKSKKKKSADRDKTPIDLP